MEIRRIKMDNHPTRGDVMWLLFERGNIRRPVLCLTDLEMEALVANYDEQNGNHEEAAHDGGGEGR